jgi:capsular polysaccharide biosynthesis protein
MPVPELDTELAAAGFVYRLPNAMLLGQWAYPSVNQGQVLTDLTPNGIFDLEAVSTLRTWREDPIHCDGPLWSLCGRWSGNFYHLMTEHLPSLAMANALGFDGAYLVPGRSPTARDFLALLGIPENRIIPHGGQNVEARELYISRPLPGHELHRYPKLVERYRALVLNALPEPNQGRGRRRIYVSRNQSRPVRHILNEPELMEVLRRYGFETIYTEKLNIREQLLTVRDAECWIGPHGAAFSHLLFAPPGCLAIEMFSPQYVNPCMLSTINLLKQRYYQLVSHVNPVSSYPHGENIVVDTGVLEQYLRQELGK